MLGKKRVYDISRLRYFAPYEGKIIRFEKYWTKEILRKEHFFEIFYNALDNDEIKDLKFEKMSRVKMKILRFYNEKFFLAFLGISTTSNSENLTTANLEILIFDIVEIDTKIKLRFISRKIVKANLENEFFKSFDFDIDSGILEVVKGNTKDSRIKEFYFLKKDMNLELIKVVVNERKMFSVDQDHLYGGVLVGRCENGVMIFERFFKKFFF